MSKQIAEAQQSSASMLAIIEKVALDPDVNVDKMEKMLDMQERIFNKQAEIAFNKDMVACQAAIPTVAATVSNNQTNSKYAKFEHIMITIKPVLAKHGFCLSFGSEKSESEHHIVVTCDVMHSGGFSKRYQSDMPIDLTGIKGSVNKTNIHATASAYSYGKRYLTAMIFSIAIANEDDDAIKAGGVTIERMLEGAAAVRELIHSIAAIKASIETGELDSAVEAWQELTQPEQASLWVAPSKGGVFTTDERREMRSNEWVAIAKERMQDPAIIN